MRQERKRPDHVSRPMDVIGGNIWVVLIWGVGEVGAPEEIPVQIAIDQLRWRLTSPDQPLHQNIKVQHVRVRNFHSGFKTSEHMTNSLL